MQHQPQGPRRCGACGEKALPKQTHCLHCKARLLSWPPPAVAGADGIQSDSLPPSPRADGKCPGCDKELPPTAVLCIECGYDLRTGRKRETVHGAIVEPEGRRPIASFGI